MVKVSTEVMLIVLALLCLPNLFYRATFNIPFLLFAVIMWPRNKSLASQLIVVSLVIEFYQLLDILVTNNHFVNPQKNPVLLSFTILVFVLKVNLSILADSVCGLSCGKRRGIQEICFSQRFHLQYWERTEGRVVMICNRYFIFLLHLPI